MHSTAMTGVGVVPNCVPSGMRMRGIRALTSPVYFGNAFVQELCGFYRFVLFSVYDRCLRRM